MSAGDPPAGGSHRGGGVTSNVPPAGGTERGGGVPPHDSSAVEELERIRAEIEALDRELVALIGRRVALGREVGRCKRRLGLSVLDTGREAAVVRRSASAARAEGLEEDDVRTIFWHLIGLSRRAQMEES